MSDGAELVSVERVRCLGCGAGYLKPNGGSRASRDSGCPRCGYVGWISAAVPVSETERRRSVEDQRLRPNDQRR